MAGYSYTNNNTLLDELSRKAHFLITSTYIPSTSFILPIVTKEAGIINDNIKSNKDEYSLTFNVPSVLVLLSLLVIILGTIIGNILVCVAVCMVKKLRRPYNYLLVSLAVSDLCVAILVMPVALLNELWGRWRFGPLICDIWVSFDVLSCTASILNLCMISVDRYLAITKPLEYGVKRTPKRMFAYIAIVWIGAGFVSVPPVLILGNEHGDGSRCEVCQNFYYQIYATFASFYLPLSVMVTVYYKIFRAAWRIVTEERRARAHLRKVEDGAFSHPAEAATTTTFVPAAAATSPQVSPTPHASSHSVVEVRNGGINTRLAPSFLPLQPPLMQHKASCVPLLSDGTTYVPSRASSDAQSELSHGLLELPAPRHLTCPSPASSVTTCGSVWSLRSPGHSAGRHGSLSRDARATSISSETIRPSVCYESDQCKKDSSAYTCVGSKLDDDEIVPDYDVHSNRCNSRNDSISSNATIAFNNLDVTGMSEPLQVTLSNIAIANTSWDNIHIGEIKTTNSSSSMSNDAVNISIGHSVTIPVTSSISHSDNITVTQSHRKHLGSPVVEENIYKIIDISNDEDNNSFTKYNYEVLCSSANDLNTTDSSYNASKFKDSVTDRNDPCSEPPSRKQSGTPPPAHKKSRQSRMKFQLAKERKASTTLGIIMSAFIICWLPFFVLALVRPFLRDPTSIPISISSLFLWLGYANSTLNPIIYATLNKDFRKPFQEILCMRCSSLNNLMREDFYHSQFGPDTPTLSHVRVNNAPQELPDSPDQPGLHLTDRDAADAFKENSSAHNESKI